MAQQNAAGRAAGQSVLRGAGIMMAATVASRVLGWVRDRGIGHYFGHTRHTDAYWSAFNVPDILYYLLAGGALSAAFIPVFTGYLVAGQEEEGWRVVNTLATLLVLLVSVGVALIVIFAPWLVLLAAPGLRQHPATWAECAFYTRIMAAMVLFTVLSALSTGVLQAFRHFTAPAVAWLAYNVGILVGLFVLSRSLGIAGVCIGVLIGAASMVAVQVPALVKRGYRFRPALELEHEGVRLVIRLFLPVMAGLALTQIGLLWLPVFFGSYFPEGVLTSLRYANRLIVLPLGLFAIAISTAAFPALAAQVSEGKTEQFKRTLADGLRAVMALAIPSAVALGVLAEPVVRVVWQSGQFGDQAIAQASYALVFLAAGLVGLSVMQIVNRGFYSLKDTVTPPLVGIGYVALNILMVVAALDMHLAVGFGAIALAGSLSASIGCVVLVWLLARKLGGVHGAQLLASLGRVVLASAALGVVAWLVGSVLGQRLGVPMTHFALVEPQGHWMPGPSQVSRLHVLMQALGAMGAGGAAYLAVLWALRASELEAVVGAVRSRVGRRPQPRPATGGM